MINSNDNTNPVGTGECVYTYVFYKKEEAHMQKRHNEDIIMYYYDHHFVVVDVWMPDDNTIHLYNGVICDTTSSTVYHIGVWE